MPIYEIACKECFQVSEVLVPSADQPVACPGCGSVQTERLMSATSSLTGRNTASFPGAGDTTCCGNAPGAAGCAGPGSCCGKMG